MNKIYASLPEDFHADEFAAEAIQLSEAEFTEAIHWHHNQAIETDLMSYHDLSEMHMQAIFLLHDVHPKLVESVMENAA